MLDQYFYKKKSVSSIFLQKTMLVQYFYKKNVSSI